MNGNDYTDEYGYGRINAYAALKYTLENYGGTLSGDVTITETLKIQPGNTLTILPGTTVRFQGSTTNLNLQQGANLVAVGTPSEPILFTSADANPGSKSWRHVWLYGSNNQLEHCTFEYGNIFYIYGYPSASNGNTVKNCTFRYFDHGLHVQQSTVTIENVTLENNRHAFVFHPHSLRAANIGAGATDHLQSDRPASAQLSTRTAGGGRAHGGLGWTGQRWPASQQRRLCLQTQWPVK